MFLIDNYFQSKVFTVFVKWTYFKNIRISKTMAAAEKIINGYIREIQLLFDNKIIPNEINQLCLKYYLNKRILSLVLSINNRLHIAFCNFDQDDINDDNIEWLTDISTNDVFNEYVDIPSVHTTISALLYKENFNVPLEIKNNLKKSSQYDCIFKIAGQDTKGATNTAFAFIFNSMYLQPNDQSGT